MATLTMEQDPDLKRFIEDRKQRYYDNDKAAVFATSLPLSNNGVEDRRSQLRDERHRDYQRYLERFGQQYQKPGDEHIENPFLPPPGAMPKSPAKREVQQQRMDRKYDQKYDQILQETEQKHQDESERNRTRYSPSRPQAPSQPRSGDIDYSQMKQELADERKRDYQDYLQQQEHMYVRAQQENGIPVLDRTPREDSSYVTSKPPPGPRANRRDERESERYRPHADELPPPGPSDFPKGHHYSSDEYEKYRKELQQKQQAEYQDFLQKKYDPPKDAIGLPIGQYRYEPKRLAMEAERNREYNELQKNKESVKLSESSQGLPIGPYRYRDKIQQMESQRNKEYNEYLQKKQYNELLKKRRDTTMGDLGSSPRLTDQDDVVPFLRHQREIEYKKTTEEQNRPKNKEDPTYGKSLPLGQFDELRPLFEKQRNRDYREHLKKLEKKSRAVTPLELSGLPIGQHNYDTINKAMETQRNREYNEFLEKKNQQAPNRTWRDSGDNAQGLILGDSKHENQKKLLNDERRREYNEHLAQKQMSDPPRFGRNTPPVVGPYSGIFAGLGQYDLDKQRLKKERQSEYTNYLDKTYAEKGRPYGRPTWAKDIDDNEQYPARPYSYEHQSNPETKPRDHLPPIEGQGQGERRPPSYEDMLAKKRQVEADRRRYDPGFAPRDDRYEAERSGPPRDGDYALRDGGYGGDGNQGQDRYRY